MATSYTKSPYQVFKDWLFDNNINSELDTTALNVVNKLSALAMFGRLNQLTIYLNDQYNNYNIMTLPDIEFFKFLKQCVIKHKISKYELTFFSIKKTKLENTELLDYYPLLNSDEIKILLNDDNIKSQLQAIIKPDKFKVKKLTKKEKDLINKGSLLDG